MSSCGSSSLLRSSTGSALKLVLVAGVAFLVMTPRNAEATCPWQIKSVTAPNAEVCQEVTATIELTAPASQHVLVVVSIILPEGEPEDPPPPGDAVFSGMFSGCGQGPHMVLAFIPQGEKYAHVPYIGLEETDTIHPITLEACIATNDCALPVGTCNPTNCRSDGFHVTPSTLAVDVDWTSNPSNMISVNGDYDENQADDQRDNEGDPGIVAGDGELKTIDITISGPAGLKGKWKWSGASNIKLWKSLTEEVPSGQESDEITLPQSITLTMEGISPSADLDATTLTVTFTPSNTGCDPVDDDMSFTVVKAEINNGISPDKNEDLVPGVGFCANDDYDEGGPGEDNADTDPEHNTTHELIVDDMISPTLEVKPDTAAFLSAVKVKLPGARDIARVFGTYDDGEGNTDWELITGTLDISSYFGNQSKSDWVIRLEGLGTGSADLNLIVERGIYEVARDTVRYNVGEMTVTPTSGEIGTVITLTACPACSGAWDDDTAVSFTGTFSPEGHPSTDEFTVSWDSSKVYYDESLPDQLKIIVGEALPGSGDFWSNAGVEARTRGVVTGTIEAGECSTGGLFYFAPSTHQNGYELFDYALTGPGDLLALPLNDSLDVNRIITMDPYGEGVYRARIVAQPTGSVPPSASPPGTIDAIVRGRTPEGTLVSSGVTATFELYSSAGSVYKYRAVKPFLINASDLEGEFSEAYVVRASKSARIEIVVQP